jgi:hypothetical protein
LAHAKVSAESAATARTMENFILNGKVQ